MWEGAIVLLSLGHYKKLVKINCFCFRDISVEPELASQRHVAPALTILFDMYRLAIFIRPGWLFS
jgi:hypothetical protein